MNQGNSHQTSSDTLIAVNGYTVKAIRELAGLSRPDLAKQAQINPSYLAKIENGHRGHINPAMFVRLWKTLSVDRRALLANPHAEVAA